eukprot:g38227.t1
MLPLSPLALLNKIPLYSEVTFFAVHYTSNFGAIYKFTNYSSYVHIQIIYINDESHGPSTDPYLTDNIPDTTITIPGYVLSQQQDRPSKGGDTVGYSQEGMTLGVLNIDSGQCLMPSGVVSTALSEGGHGQQIWWDFVEDVTRCVGEGGAVDVVYVDFSKASTWETDEEGRERSQPQLTLLPPSPEQVQTKGTATLVCLAN